MLWLISSQTNFSHHTFFLYHFGIFLYQTEGWPKYYTKFLTQKFGIKKSNFEDILVYLLCLGEIWDYGVQKVLTPRWQMSTFIRKMIKNHAKSVPNWVSCPTMIHFRPLRGQYSDFTVFKNLIFLYQIFNFLIPNILIFLYHAIIIFWYNDWKKRYGCIIHKN